MYYSWDIDGQKILQFANLNFPRYRVCTPKQRIVMSFILGYFYFTKNQKISILGNFCPF